MLSYDPQSATVSIDGINVKANSEDLEEYKRGPVID